MAGRFPALDQMTGARAGGHLSNFKPVHTSDALNALQAAQTVYELVVRQNLEEAVDMSQEGNAPLAYNSMISRMSASSGAHADPLTLHSSQNLPVTQQAGFLHEGYEGVQSFGGKQLRSGISEGRASEDRAARNEYQQFSGNSSLGNDERVLLVFPEDDDDAVTISERDMEGLQPKGFLSDNIIDFYIKYLKMRLSPEDRERFHFFNSFFFRTLLESSTICTDIDQWKVDYEQVRKWCGGENLFEKDYIFLPVLRREEGPTLCISFGPDGRDAWELRRPGPEAWMQRYQAAENMEQLLALCQMKYMKAKVPQQDNGYDCGLYILHYVEVFLREPSLLDFSFGSSKALPHFAAEVSSKRMAIQILIRDLCERSREQAVKLRKIQFLSRELRRISQELLTCLDGGDISGGGIDDVQNNDISMFGAQGDGSKHTVHLLSRGIVGENQLQQSVMVTDIAHSDHETTCALALDTKPEDGVEIEHAEYRSASEVVLGRHQQPQNTVGAVLPRHSSKRKWTEEETTTLLQCKAEGGDRFYKGNHAATRGDVISREIESRVGTTPAEVQCRLRYDTLLKAFKTMKKYCVDSGSKFSEITEAVRVELKLATTLTEKWYEAIDEICRRKPDKAKSQKRVNPNPSNGDGLLSSGPSNPAALSPAAPDSAPIYAAALIPSGSSRPRKSSKSKVVVPEFSALGMDLQRTLLNLLQAASIFHQFSGIRDFFQLRVMRYWLATVQDQEPSDIDIIVQKLLDLKLVETDYRDQSRLKPSVAWNYKKVAEEVLLRNPDLVIHHLIRQDRDSVIFPKCPVSLSLQQIRVLILLECRVLEHVDLRFLPELRLLRIEICKKLKTVSGWEIVKELGWLLLDECCSLEAFPRIECLPSLKEFHFKRSSAKLTIPELDFSQSCGRMRLLKIEKIDSLALNLSTLRFLEVLNLLECGALTAIQGLSELHSLTELRLEGCKALRRVPELGCLKALTDLDLYESGVEEISGVEELHLLTSLKLDRCKSLKTLPELGNLKALVDLEKEWSGVEEIPGVENLVSLETLYCTGSRLKWLPDLRHLPRLRELWVGDTPLKVLPWLGHLKALAWLDISGSDVEEISGVQELHLLVHLNLDECKSLEVLPWLGHLKALVELDISGSGVEEIPGLENLVSLETLTCVGSRLKGLPDLHHLPRLRVWVGDTPLSTTDPSSFYYGKYELKFNSGSRG